MKQKVVSVAHGYDGYVIIIQTKTLTGIAAEWLGDKILNIVDPCCRGIWDHRYSWKLDEDGEPKLISTLLYDWCHRLAGPLWKFGNKGGRDHYYPVTDEWAEEYYDAVFGVDRVKWDTGTRDPNYPKIKCPECGLGVLNRWNTDSITKHGECLICFSKNGRYGGLDVPS